MITLCHRKIEVPPLEDRQRIIKKYHSNLVGGHKGITKTYLRIRERYSWPGMRDKICTYIREYKNFLDQKLVRTRICKPLFITNTHFGVFKKVTLDTVGWLPKTPNGYRIPGPSPYPMQSLLVFSWGAEHPSVSWPTGEAVLSANWWKTWKNCSMWNWLPDCLTAMFFYNMSVHEETQFTPCELVFSRVARTPSSFPQGVDLKHIFTAS